MNIKKMPIDFCLWVLVIACIVVGIAATAGEMPASNACKMPANPCEFKQRGSSKQQTIRPTKQRYYGENGEYLGKITDDGRIYGQQGQYMGRVKIAEGRVKQEE